MRKQTFAHKSERVYQMKNFKTMKNLSKRMSSMYDFLPSDSEKSVKSITQPCEIDVTDPTFDSRSVYEPILPCKYLDKYKRLSPETVSKLVEGDLKVNRPVLIIDCRYSFEYQGTFLIKLQAYITRWPHKRSNQLHQP